MTSEIKKRNTFVMVKEILTLKEIAPSRSSAMIANNNKDETGKKEHMNNIGVIVVL